MKSQAVFILSLIGLSSAVAVPSSTTVPAVTGNCDDVICISEQHPVFHPELNACTCEWIPGLEPGPPVDTGSSPPPETCPTIRCADGFTPVFHPETGSCTCEASS